MSLKRLFSFQLVILLLLLSACSFGQADDKSTQVGTTAVVEVDPAVTTTLTHEQTLVQPTETSTAILPTPTIEPTDSPTPEPKDLSLTLDDLQLFPVPDIFSGDRVTFQILPYVPEGIAVNNISVDIFIDERQIASETLDSRNWVGQAEGVYEWIWDTSGLPGEHEVRIVLDNLDIIEEGDENKENNEVSFSVQVRRAGERPLAERDATWVTAETDCCNIHAQTQTAAYRDLSQLLGTVESAVAQAAIQLREEPDHKLDVYFIDRTIGQGGYAGTDIVATYVDRSYAGGNLHELLVHEAVHVLDRQFAPQRLKFLAEGLAVWAGGGHYKAEELNKRMAALVQLGNYIPLADLVEDFYLIQHETGYLEAGGFVSYLIDEYGYQRFRDFYTATSADDAPTGWEVLNVNLQESYGKSLSQIEAEWLQSLQAIPSDPVQIADLETTIRYYETMRRYQRQYDPTAYFLTAWLPHPGDVREEGNPADLRRHPQTAVHVTLEIMLQVAEDAMMAGDFNRANVLLDSIDRILNEHGAFADPLSANYRDIVDTAINYGYEVQDIFLKGDEAEVLATTASGFHLSRLNMQRKRGDWVMSSN